MKLYAGIDLHSNNSFIQIIDDKDKIIFSKRLVNRMEDILIELDPYKGDLKQIAVESTFNWYWLVDGLMENGYHVNLANPSAMKQYEGLKHTDDKHDAYLLAHLQRLSLLPKGHVYPKEQRGLRDLLRRRMLYTQQRTTQILSLQSMISRNLGINMSGSAIKKLKTGDDIDNLFDDEYLNYTANLHVMTIQFFKIVIRGIEKVVEKQAECSKEYPKLLTIPGIGRILGMTIMLEAGDIRRFKAAGNYSSYCRCVDSNRLSNGKKKGKNNQKNGNPYLAWAYVEAANFMKRYSDKANAFYQRKKARSNSGVLAIKALSNKICKASYFVMRDQVDFDEEKLFKH